MSYRMYKSLYVGYYVYTNRNHVYLFLTNASHKHFVCVGKFFFYMTFIT